MVKKIHFVTGKGGVGKSVFSAAFATSKSLQNQHILLAELNETSFFKDFLILDAISYKPSEWKTHLDICQWSPEECLKEYALHLLKIEGLYKLFLQNPVSKSLIQIAPGLHELALLGKITSSPRNHGPPMNYDQIVIDSFATGHFLSLLRAPSAMAEAIPFGPMGEQSKSIDTWIRNSDFTEIHIVTTAEDLPMTETLELYKTLKNEFGIVAKVYLNKVMNLQKKDFIGFPEDNDFIIYFKTILENENRAVARMNELQIPFVEVPFILKTENNSLVQNISESLSKYV